MRRLQSRDAPSSGHCATALLLAVTAFACSASKNISMRPNSAPATVAFENATIDPVAVYVAYGGTQWLLGHVEPTYKARLRLPDFVTTKLSEVVLVAVPLGTRRDGARGDEVADAIRSELEPTQHLFAMQWTLTGHTLAGAMLPAKRR